MLPAHGPEKALQVAKIGDGGPQLRPGARLSAILGGVKAPVARLPGILRG